MIALLFILLCGITLGLVWVVLYQVSPLEQKVRELQARVTSSMSSLEGMHTSVAAIQLTVDTIDSEVQKTLEKLAEDVNGELAQVEIAQDGFRGDIDEIRDELISMQSEGTGTLSFKDLEQAVAPVLNKKPVKKPRKRKKSS